MMVLPLNDLVSYSEKHNWDNGEANRDGDSHNLSNNYGVEGPTDIAEVEALRNRQCKNMLATLLLSLGTPMISMGGDEVRRTQRGNNNAYCQDNEISWFDWRLTDKHADMLRFVTLMNQIRRTEQQLIGICICRLARCSRMSGSAGMAFSQINLIGQSIPIRWHRQ